MRASHRRIRELTESEPREARRRERRLAIRVEQLREPRPLPARLGEQLLRPQRLQGAIGERWSRHARLIGVRQCAQEPLRLRFLDRRQRLRPGVGRNAARQLAHFERAGLAGLALDDRIRFGGRQRPFGARGRQGKRRLQLLVHEQSRQASRRDLDLLQLEKPQRRRDAEILQQLPRDGLHVAEVRRLRVDLFLARRPRFPGLHGEGEGGAIEIDGERGSESLAQLPGQHGLDGIAGERRPSLFMQRDTGMGSIEARQGAAERLAQLFERGTADEELRRAQGHGIEHTLTQPPALDLDAAARAGAEQRAFKEPSQ